MLLLILACDRDRTATDGPRCATDRECPSVAPFCCADSTTGARECHQWAFVLDGQAWCVNDECATRADCPDELPICCSFDLLLGGIPVRGCADAAFATTGGDVFCDL